MKNLLRIPALILFVMTANFAAARPGDFNEQKLTCGMGREYYLYTPDRIDPNKTYWLVAGIHGANGNGQLAGGLASWTKQENCIVVGPSFPNGYQGLALQTDQQMLGIFETLSAKYKLHRKFFITGFSGGAQFAHRFTLAHADVVVGCAAHSGGSWATGDLPGDITSYQAAAENVPMVISCGMLDKALSMTDSPFNRIDWAHQFEKVLADKQFYFKTGYWPGTGHASTKGSMALTEECFHLSTTGLHPPQKKQVDQLFVPIEMAVANHDKTRAATRLGSIEKDVAVLLVKFDELKPSPGEKAQWHENDTMKKELAKRAMSYAKDRAAELSAALQPTTKPATKPSTN